ncbi:MAG: hypothetical protein QF714_04855 [Dehalococcoidia bacterium]|nr:hypothetical protein [Dehalococcoidia bacterium]MDP6227023.1 hypothetical protein [Dehalococcoidia bacterium]MDP7083645.1 hypothetical protein [Dehalococcoidia bacterium]MDP7199537.1 hypothetical protein [Dehalococcoidia bacterium]MDP7510942.1 hypothetical protein [Dehalococcoidia bacterium]
MKPIPGGVADGLRPLDHHVGQLRCHLRVNLRPATSCLSLVGPELL